VHAPLAAGATATWFGPNHARDGIINIESPMRRTYTLGNVFDIRKQPLAPRQVGPALGTVKAFVNGKLYKGNRRTIPLLAHEQIQLDVVNPSSANRPSQADSIPLGHETGQASQTGQMRAPRTLDPASPRIADRTDIA
jgi:hypothetical protein